MNGRPFSASDDQTILAMRAEGATFEAIGRRLGRNQAAIDARHKRLKRALSDFRDVDKRVELPWKADDVRRLSSLMAGGVTYSEIARVLGRSRGSICGMVKRLRDEGTLPPPVVTAPVENVARPSPLEPMARTLPPLPSQTGEPPSIFLIFGLRARPAPPPRSSGCEWIEGEPGGGTSCGAPCVPGQAWCTHHRAVVYVPFRRQDAA